MALGTFHSVCARLLRRHGDSLPAVVPGLDGRFSIFDTEDSRRLLTDIIKENGLDVKEVCCSRNARLEVLARGARSGRSLMLLGGVLRAACCDAVEASRA